MCQEYELVKQGLNIKQPDAPAECGFSVVRRVPRKTDARFKVAKGRILKEGTGARAPSRRWYPATNRQRVHQILKIDNLAVFFCWYRGHLLTQTQI